MSNDIKDAAYVRYLTKDDIEFYETKGKMLGAKVDGQDKGRVNVLRLFPLYQKDAFFSVQRQAEGRRDRDLELGIIESLAPFPASQREMVERDLDKRYFVPVITKVVSAKEEFGHTYWECETNAGKRSFTTFDMSTSLVRTGEFSLILIDVDGNRYEIKDIRTIGDKAMKILDIWL